MTLHLKTDQFKILSILFAIATLPHLNTFIYASEICTERYAELMKSYTRLNPETLKLKAGIEIEGLISKKIGFQGVAKAIHSELLHDDPSAEFRKISKNHYEIHWKSPNEVKKIWTVILEKSIRTYETPLEITSPILENRADFRRFTDIVQLVQSIGAKSEPKGGGVHIHVDFNQARPGEMALLAGVFSEIETELKTLFSMSKSRSPFAENTDLFLNFLIQKSPLNDAPLQRLTHLLIVQDRHHALNLQSYSKYQTVEFRLFNSTFDIEALQLMLDFSIKLVHAIRTQDPGLMEYLLTEHQKIDLQDVAKILNMKISKPKAKIVLNRIFREAEEAMKDPSDLDPHESSVSRTLTVLLSSTAAVNLIAESAEPLIAPSINGYSND